MILALQLFVLGVVAAVIVALALWALASDDTSAPAARAVQVVERAGHRFGSHEVTPVVARRVKAPGHAWLPNVTEAAPDRDPMPAPPQLSADEGREATMVISDEEIDRAVSSVTPTASAAPAPNVLREMRAAMHRERWAFRQQRLVQWVRAGSVPAAYIALALSIFGLVMR